MEDEKKRKEAKKVISKYVNHKYKANSSGSSSTLLPKSPQSIDIFEKFYNPHHDTEKPRALKIWKSVRNVVYVIILALYATMGGAIFMMVEKNETEQNFKTEIEDRVGLVANMTEDLYSKLVEMDCWNSSNETVCKKEISHFLQNMTAPIKTMNWNFLNSIFYSLTTLTTIGYGNFACKSNLGKLLTILYALFGIPLTVFVLRNNGKFALKYVKKIEILCCGDHPKNSRKRYRTVSIKSAMIYTSAFWISTSLLIGAIEEFTVLDSFYFSFSTVSTIGFGDIVPTNTFTEFFSLLFHFTSLSLFSMVYAIVQERVEHKYMWALDIIDEEHKKSPANTIMATATATTTTSSSNPTDGPVENVVSKRK